MTGEDLSAEERVVLEQLRWKVRCPVKLGWNGRRFYRLILGRVAAEALVTLEADTVVSASDRRVLTAFYRGLVCDGERP